MGYQLDGREIDINGKRITKIGTGVTGDVYKYKNMALKIFKKDRTPPITLDDAHYLTGISTERILLPKNLLFYNIAFRGYTYKLVPKKGSGKRLITTPKEELIHNVQVLERDSKILSSKKVLLNGIDPSNSIFNGELYLTDPSLFSVLETASPKDLEVLNRYQLHMLLTALITSEMRKNNFSNAVEKEVKELLDSKNPEEEDSVFLKSLLRDDDSIKQLIKKI